MPVIAAPEAVNAVARCVALPAAIVQSISVSATLEYPPSETGAISASTEVALRPLVLVIKPRRMVVRSVVLWL